MSAPDPHHPAPCVPSEADRQLLVDMHSVQQAETDESLADKECLQLIANHVAATCKFMEDSMRDALRDKDHQLTSEKTAHAATRRELEQAKKELMTWENHYRK